MPHYFITRAGCHMQELRCIHVLMSFYRAMTSDGALAWARQEGLPTCQPSALITGKVSPETLLYM